MVAIEEIARSLKGLFSTDENGEPLKFHKINRGQIAEKIKQVRGEIGANQYNLLKALLIRFYNI